MKVYKGTDPGGMQTDDKAVRRIQYTVQVLYRLIEARTALSNRSLVYTACLSLHYRLYYAREQTADCCPLPDLRQTAEFHKVANFV